VGFRPVRNGPEVIAHDVADWCRFNEVDDVFIDPGSAWQNTWIESSNGRQRDELLDSWKFDSLLDASCSSPPSGRPAGARDVLVDSF
jgi:hypothetical protein